MFRFVSVQQVRNALGALLLLSTSCLWEAQGAFLHEATLAKGGRVGVMLSTFDPLTLYHEEMIELVANSGRVDYLIVIPTDFTPHKLRRATMDHRQAMLELTYANHPKVLITRAYEFGFPHSRGAVSYLRQSISANVTISAVGLFKDLAGKRLSQLVAKFLTQPDDWLIVKPKDKSAEEFPTTLSGRKVDFLEGEHPSSSKVAREFLLGNEPFYRGELSPTSAELPVNNRVRLYLQRNFLYFKKSSICSLAKDAVRSYLALIR